MQPKDRPNGWAFLETSLPLSSSSVQGFFLTHCIYFASYYLLPPPLFLSQSLCSGSRPTDTPTFPFPLSGGRSFCLAGLRCKDLVPSPGKSPADAAGLPRALEKRRQRGGGIPERLSGPSSQVSGPAGYSRKDQGAHAGSPAPTCARPDSRSPPAVSRTPFRVLAGAGIALLPASAWRRVGRSCGAGQEAGNPPFSSRRPHGAPESSALRAAFSLSFSFHRPSRSWVLIPTSARPGHRSLGASRPTPPTAPTPLWLQLVQNDNDTRARASVPG